MRGGGLVEQGKRANDMFFSKLGKLSVVCGA